MTVIFRLGVVRQNHTHTLKNDQTVYNENTLKLDEGPIHHSYYSYIQKTTIGTAHRFANINWSDSMNDDLLMLTNPNFMTLHV